jgi:hypothetical protein
MGPDPWPRGVAGKVQKSGRGARWSKNIFRLKVVRHGFYMFVARFQRFFEKKNFTIRESTGNTRESKNLYLGIAGITGINNKKILFLLYFYY